MSESDNVKQMVVHFFELPFEAQKATREVVILCQVPLFDTIALGKEPCWYCEGRGHHYGNKGYSCDWCEGTGLQLVAS